MKAKEMTYAEIQEKVDQFDDKTKLVAMLIDAIETLDEEHGTSVIQFSDEIDADDLFDQKVQADNELATQYILDYAHCFVYLTWGCYWDEERYNEIATKYDSDVVEFVNDLIQVHIYQ